MCGVVLEYEVLDEGAPGQGVGQGHVDALHQAPIYTWNRGMRGVGDVS